MLELIDARAPLSDRTLKYGRNVLVAGVVILVLAYVPYINVETFKPMGFDPDKGGAMSVWGILVAVLVYYGLQFGFGCRIEYLAWARTYKPLDQFGKKRAFKQGLPADQREKAEASLRRFWWLDVGLPVVCLLVALPTAGWQIYQLWPCFQFPVDFHAIPLPLCPN